MGSASDPKAASKLLLYPTTRNSLLLVTSLLLAPYPAGRVGGRDRNGEGWSEGLVPWMNIWGLSEHEFVSEVYGWVP